MGSKLSLGLDISASYIRSFPSYSIVLWSYKVLLIGCLRQLMNNEWSSLDMLAVHLISQKYFPRRSPFISLLCSHTVFFKVPRGRKPNVTPEQVLLPEGATLLDRALCLNVTIVWAVRPLHLVCNASPISRLAKRAAITQTTQVYMELYLHGPVFQIQLWKYVIENYFVRKKYDDNYFVRKKHDIALKYTHSPIISWR